VVFGRVQTTRPAPVGEGAKLYSFGQYKLGVPILATSIANQEGN